MKTVKKTVYALAAVLFALSALFLVACDGGSEPVVFRKQDVEVEIGAGKELHIDTDLDIDWVSFDESIVEVTDDGIIIGKEIGQAEVYGFFGSDNVCFNVTVTENTSGERYGYTLVWHDEFDGDEIDSEKWDFQTGTHGVYGDSIGPDGWGNNELQSYQKDNAAVAGGHLTVTAKKEEEKVDGKSYTSARLTTRDKFSFTYGYVEARIKCPAVDGMWPAFWMLPQPSSAQNSDNVYGGWPSNGEIDIMEAKGRLPGQVMSTLHYGGPGWRDDVTQGKTTALDSPVSEWHTYGLEWRRNYIAFYVDGEEVKNIGCDTWYTASSDKDENPYAPFDEPFYIILNLAVGGNFDPTGTDNLKNDESFESCDMCVDYVRVYK